MTQKRILIVDDDAELCAEMAEILSDEGYSVQSVSDGIEGRARISKDAYDIIILDYRMPGLNGIDILKFIKDKNIRTDIFLASGRPFIEKVLADENLLHLVTCAIPKPINPATLLEKLKAASSSAVVK